jgi:hypothetical protein
MIELMNASGNNFDELIYDTCVDVQDLKGREKLKKIRNHKA